MGWKNVKTHYAIGHIVQVTPKGICIGSGYLPELLVISLDGRVEKRYEDPSNADLSRYQAEMDADPARLQALVVEPDQFERSIEVYTYEGAEILLKHCEALGWPNVTHDGVLMYENMFSPDRDEVLEWARKNADANVKLLSRHLKDLERQVEEVRVEVARAQAAVQRLVQRLPPVLLAEADGQSEKADSP